MQCPSLYVHWNPHSYAFLFKPLAYSSFFLYIAVQKKQYQYAVCSQYSSSVVCCCKINNYADTFFLENEQKTCQKSW